MLPLIATVFVASLFGSLHCVGMCGPLAVFASSAHGQRQPSWIRMASYHLGRVVAYGLLGALVGLLGAGLQQTGTWLGMQRLAAQLAGISMLVVGMMSLVRLSTGQLHQVLLPGWLQRQLTWGQQWARRQPPLRRAFAIGILTAFLPCGWLYAFLLVAAGTASLFTGAWVMVVFSLGSVPALMGVVASTHLVLGRFQKYIPWASAFLVTIVGFYTWAHRANADLLSLSKTQNSPMNLIDQVLTLQDETMPCCEGP